MVGFLTDNRKKANRGTMLTGHAHILIVRKKRNILKKVQDFQITLYGCVWLVDIHFDVGDFFEAHALVDRPAKFRSVQHNAVFSLWQRFQRTFNGGAHSDFCVTMLHQCEQKMN